MEREIVFQLPLAETQSFKCQIFLIQVAFGRQGLFFHCRSSQQPTKIKTNHVITHDHNYDHKTLRIRIHNL